MITPISFQMFVFGAQKSGQSQPSFLSGLYVQYLSHMRTLLRNSP